MIKSLQEQLVSSGLIDKKKAKKIKSEQQKINRKKRGPAARQSTGRASIEVSNEHAERDRELNRQRQLLSEQKAVAAQIRQMVQSNRLPRDNDGDIAFNFVDQGRVKKIYIDRETRDRLSAGKLAIVAVDNQYDLVSSNLVEKLRKRSETCVIFHNDPQKREESTEDDYSDHKVPDDLMW